MKLGIQLDRQALSDLCHKWKIRELSVFGSALRDDFSPQSDVDFLISFEPKAGWDLWDLMELREQLVSIAGRNVDMVVKEALRNPYRRRNILEHREIIHAAC